MDSNFVKEIIHVNDAQDTNIDFHFQIQNPKKIKSRDSTYVHTMFLLDVFQGLSTGGITEGSAVFLGEVMVAICASNICEVFKETCSKNQYYNESSFDTCSKLFNLWKLLA
jgi:hypothetical protein